MKTIDLETALQTSNRNKYDHKQLVDAVKAVIKAKNIVCMAGAGISTSAGIPDFRSKNGLYDLAASGALSESRHPPVSAPIARVVAPKASSSSKPSRMTRSGRGQATTSGTQTQSQVDIQRPPKSTSASGADLFDASVYRSADSLFKHLRFVAALHALSSHTQPTATHRFMTTLQNKGKLRRLYTQNIDGLERRAGLTVVDTSFDAQTAALLGSALTKGKGKASEAAQSSSKPRSLAANRNRYPGSVIHLHGQAGSVRCTVCRHTSTWSDDVHTAYQDGRLPPCSECASRLSARQIAGRRSITAGCLRPNITLYGEDGGNDAAFISDVHEADIKSRPDCLIVMGTSLKVHGFKLLVKDFALEVQDRGGVAIFVSLGKPSSSWESVFDYCIDGTSDAFVDFVSSEWKRTRPQDFESQPTLITTIPRFNVIKKLVDEAVAVKVKAPAARPTLSPKKIIEVSVPVAKKRESPAVKASPKKRTIVESDVSDIENQVLQLPNKRPRFVDDYKESESEASSGEDTAALRTPTSTHSNIIEIADTEDEWSETEEEYGIRKARSLIRLRDATNALRSGKASASSNVLRKEQTARSDLSASPTSRIPVHQKHRPRKPAMASYTQADGHWSQRVESRSSDSGWINMMETIRGFAADAHPLPAQKRLGAISGKDRVIAHTTEL